MLLMFRPHSRRLPAVALIAVSLFLIGATSVRAQAVAALNPEKVDRGPGAVSESTDGTTPEKKPDTTEEKLSALERMLLEQGQRLNQLQQTIAEQQETIRLLASRLTTTERQATTAGPAGTAQPAAALAEGASQPATQESLPVPVPVG